MAEITVLLRTLNPGTYLPPLFDVLKRQTVRPVEILVVDSGSTDGSVEFAGRAGARVIPMEPSAFTHAGSTNLGFSEAKGGWVAMLSQDALPTDERWLERLAAPLAEKHIDAAFGRQLPRIDCFPLERWELERCYPELPPAQVVYSNVNSIAKKERWNHLPFDESLKIAEDRAWALALEKLSKRPEYVPEASVWHSHTYSLREVYLRCCAEARARRQSEGTAEGWPILVRGWPVQTTNDARRLFAEGEGRRWPRAAVYRLFQFAGMVAGGRS